MTFEDFQLECPGYKKRILCTLYEKGEITRIRTCSEEICNNYYLYDLLRKEIPTIIARNYSDDGITRALITKNVLKD